MATDRESFLKNLKRCEFGSVLMTYSDPANSLPGAASKFGGAPSLPSDVQWPTWRSPMFKKERPLSFVAQINCREASPYDVENILPKSGVIYFFADSVYGANRIDDQKSWFVYYYDGPEDALTSRDIPPELFDKNYPSSVFVEKSISFSSQPSVPDLAELPFYVKFGIDESNRQEFKTLTAIRQKYCGSESDEFDHYFTERSFLLGYPDLIQGPLAPKCVLDDLGIAEFPSTNEGIAAFFKTLAKWTLLAQFGPIGKTHGMGEYEFIWADCGNFYFFIKEEDLKQKKFDAIWAESDCY